MFSSNEIDLNPHHTVSVRGGKKKSTGRVPIILVVEGRANTSVDTPNHAEQEL